MSTLRSLRKRSSGRIAFGSPSTSRTQCACVFKEGITPEKGVSIPVWSCDLLGKKTALQIPAVCTTRNQPTSFTYVEFFQVEEIDVPTKVTQVFCWARGVNEGPSEGEQEYSGNEACSTFAGVEKTKPRDFCGRENSHRMTSLRHR